jgi:hypothetical protein
VSVRARLIALSVVAVLVVATGVVVLMGSRTPDCSVAAPRPSLPAELRALGDFDQSYDVSNAPVIEDAAERAAATLHSDLIGAIPLSPVLEAAAQAGSPDAVVVPLRSPLSSTPAGAPLSGLVVFLRDCQGAAYFASVEDDATVQPPLQQFPPVSHDEATAQLGAAAPRLVYTTDPLHPRWTIGSGPGRSMPAR